MLVVLSIIAWFAFRSADSAARVDSFEECVAAGNPIMETFPRRCRSGNKTFIESAPNNADVSSRIRVTVPEPQQAIASPLAIEGKARGSWFFEASFPIRLLDSAGNEIAFTTGQAQGNWMTDDWVLFKAVLTFTAPTSTATGVLVFEKDNPSGLLAYDERLTIPIRFAAASSTTSASGSAAVFNDVITLAVHDRVQFSDGLTVQLLEINDSRCPAGVQCIWAGELSARLEISGGKAGTTTAEMRLGTSRNRQTALGGYTFELIDATPTQIRLRVEVGVAALSLNSRFKIY